MIHEKIDELIRERISEGSGLNVEDILLVQALTGSQGGQGLDLNAILPLLVAGGGIGRTRADRLALIALITALQAQQQTAGNISGGTQPTSTNTLTLLLALGLLGGRERAFYLPRRAVKSEAIEEAIEEDVAKEEGKDETGRRHRRT